jgi:aminopeptidase 2
MRAILMMKRKYRPYTLTQFEPTAARRASPCWDEPSLKATYSITMVSRLDTVALSNMQVADEFPLNAVENVGNETNSIRSLVTGKAGLSSNSLDANEWKITAFGKTPPVSN